ncbi:MAG TPA: GTP-binding protein [Anaerolineae bacterium]|nr:GTP-binding protein [Anaerolineae bacterium]
MQSDHPLEIVLIGGFLGSGKTTLLKRLLDWEIAQGSKPIVIMNEFGELDIDSRLIDSGQIEIRRLSGGCICCDMRLALTNTLEDLAQKSPGAHVYLETTGVADPAGVLEAIAPVAMKGRIVIKKVMLVYDASLGEALQEDQYTAQRQLLMADVILINRCDTVSPDEVETAVKQATQLKPDVPLYRTAYCDVDPAELLTGDSAAEYPAASPPSTDNYRSLAFVVDKPLGRNCLEGWLSSLPSDVLRVKGFVRLADEEGLWEVQAVRQHHTILPFDSLARQRSVLVAVAHPQGADSLMSGLEECAEER